MKRYLHNVQQIVLPRPRAKDSVRYLFSGEVFYNVDFVYL